MIRLLFNNIFFSFPKGRGPVMSSVLVVGFLFLALAGCTPKHNAIVPEGNKSETSSEDPFALAISRMVPGEQAVMPSPYGSDSLVMLERDYTSGLGLSCRKIRVTAGGTLHRLAVCKDDSGWFVSPPIFEQSQR